ncbi:FxLYD domain-containing protein [Leptotrichia wadei]|uniref:FxLYD domain-containing protein n=1 Tax=Leptotrichia wadei TaxID=157687 RepID=UPI0028D2D69D|nr:FxLYD domain-containing protein [Leptotrichia wadei]
MKRRILLFGIMLGTSSCGIISGVGSVVGGTIKAAGGVTGAVIGTTGKLIGGIIGGSNGEIKAKNTKYKFSDAEVEITGGKTIVTGILTHNGVTKKNLTIEIPCFDKNGAKVGDAVDNISSLAKNEKWEFQATLNKNETKTCKLKDTYIYEGNTNMIIEGNDEDNDNINNVEEK